VTQSRRREKATGMSRCTKIPAAPVTALQLNAVQLNAVQLNAVQLNAVQLNAVQLNAVLISAASEKGALRKTDATYPAKDRRNSRIYC
jgi:hypothetical protein